MLGAGVAGEARELHGEEEGGGVGDREVGGGGELVEVLGVGGEEGEEAALVVVQREGLLRGGVLPAATEV